jgi:hypothetical protein
LKSSRSPRSTPLPASSKSFPYRALYGALLKPAVPLVIHGPKNRLTTPGLIDSGADYSMFPASFAVPLGIDLATECHQETCTTAGGDVTQHIYEAALEVEIQAMATRIPLKVAFLANVPVVLLGRTDFFSQFKVLFDERSQTFTLEPY